MIAEPCYWYENEQKMKAVCTDCRDRKAIKGFFWAGDLYGYGDYDLNCSICNKELHKRDNDEIKTSVQDSRREVLPSELDCR